MVMATIAVLSTLAVQFAYDTRVKSKITLGERDRLKAFYLAKSAHNFMLLELKFDRIFRRIVQEQNLAAYLGQSAQLPLCQQFPMSTALIRAVFLEGNIPGMGVEGETDTNETKGEETARPGGEGAEDIEGLQAQTTISQEKLAEEFLKFDGDFNAECIDEGTKINLNGFWGLAATPSAEGGTSPFDQYKLFLLKFLSNPKYDDLFEAEGLKVQDVVTNIADWVTHNSETSQGSRRAFYDKEGIPYSVIAGKLLTLPQAYLIDGVVDEWFAPLTDSFTVYGDGKINVCTASQDVVEGVIRRYVDSTPGLPPLRLEDPQEMSRLTQAISDACTTGGIGEQLKQQISQGLAQAIGQVSSAEPTPPPPSGQTPPTQPTQAQTGFASYISTEPRFFQLRLSGEVGDTTVTIKTIIDVKEQDPKKWKVMYWRVY